MWTENTEFRVERRILEGADQLSAVIDRLIRRRLITTAMSALVVLAPVAASAHRSRAVLVPELLELLALHHLHGAIRTHGHGSGLDVLLHWSLLHRMRHGLRFRRLATYLKKDRAPRGKTGKTARALASHFSNRISAAAPLC